MEKTYSCATEPVYTEYHVIKYTNLKAVSNYHISTVVAKYLCVVPFLVKHVLKTTYEQHDITFVPLNVYTYVTNIIKCSRELPSGRKTRVLR